MKKPLTLTSSAFESGQPIPLEYTCDGDSINPPLKIEGVIPEVKSLVLIMEDPDSSNGTFDHWILWNIHPRTKIIEEGYEPEEAMAGKGSSGSLDYEGPCPHSGTHRYLFKVYGIDTVLSLPKGSTKEDVMEEIEGHILQEGELMGTYEKIENKEE